MTEMIDTMGSSWIEQFVAGLYSVKESEFAQPPIKIQPYEIIIGPMSKFQIRLWTKANGLSDEIIELEYNMRKTRDPEAHTALSGEIGMVRRVRDLTMTVLRMELLQTYGKPDFTWDYGFREGWQVVKTRNPIIDSDHFLRQLQSVGVFELNGRPIEEFYGQSAADQE